MKNNLGNTSNIDNISKGIQKIQIQSKKMIMSQEISIILQGNYWRFHNIC